MATEAKPTVTVDSNRVADTVRMTRKTYLEFADENGNTLFSGIYENGQITINCPGNAILVKPQYANSIIVVQDKK